MKVYVIEFEGDRPTVVSSTDAALRMCEFYIREMCVDIDRVEGLLQELKESYEYCNSDFGVDNYCFVSETDLID